MASLPDAEKLCEQLARELKAQVKASTAMVGIYTGGAWLAERLHAVLGLQEPLGLLDIAFYRDDYAKQGLAKDPKRSKIPFEVEGRDLLLVDDVLHTGRTVRAAMNELFDYGRQPRSRWWCWPSAAAASCRSARSSRAPGLRCLQACACG